MSPSISTLRIKTNDPAAQIKVFDGSANLVANGLSNLEAPLEPGFYKIRVRVGSVFEERLISLDDSLPVQEFNRIEVPSPIPMDEGARSHEYHQQAVLQTWNAAVGARLGDRAAVLICVREWSPDGSRSRTSPAAGLTVIEPSGERVSFADFAIVREEGDACAVGVLMAKPGPYQVELKLPDGSCLLRALHVSAGWATQLYMLFHDVAGERLPNLSDGSVAIAKQPIIHDSETRLIEIALDALTQHRPILSETMRALLSGKFRQPVLGLLGVHLMLRDAPSDFRLHIMDRLGDMLGPDHPDLVAIRAKLLGSQLLHVTEPPMLRASWDFIVEASAANPDLIGLDTPAARMAERVVPSGAWLTWQPLQAIQKSARHPDSKLDVVRAYIQAQARAAGPARLQTMSISVAPAPLIELSEDARADLSRTLALPRPALEKLLTKL